MHSAQSLIIPVCLPLLIGIKHPEGGTEPLLLHSLASSPTHAHSAVTDHTSMFTFNLQALSILKGAQSKASIEVFIAELTLEKHTCEADELQGDCKS